MVLAAGLELAKVGESLNHGARDLWETDSVPEEHTGRQQDKLQRPLSEQERMDRWYVMFMTIGGLLAFKNDGVGFIAGMLCHWSCQSSAVSWSWRGWRFLSNGSPWKTRQSRQATTLEEEEQLLSEH
jgi:hypothetical protein